MAGQPEKLTAAAVATAAGIARNSIYRYVESSTTCAAWSCPATSLPWPVPGCGCSDPGAAHTASGLTRGVLDAGFRLLDAGVPVDDVVEISKRAIRGRVYGIAPRR